MRLACRSAALGGLIGVVCLPILGHFALHGVGDVVEPWRYLIPASVGLSAGVAIGWARGRWRESVVRLQAQLERSGALQAELGSQRTVLDALLAHTTMPIFMKDRGGRYRLANSQFARLVGGEPSDILGRRDEDLFPPEIVALFGEQDRAVMAERGPLDFEETIPLPGGIHTFLTAKFPILGVDGAVEGVGGVCTDITSRKLAEAIQEQERVSLAVTLRLVGDGVISADSEGRIQLLNRAAERLTGWTQAQAQGIPLDDVLRLEDDPRLASALPRILRQADERETRALRGRDDRVRLVSCVRSELEDAEGEALGVVVAFHDITAQVEAERELVKLEKLDSVGVLAGGIAHDFNNLLMAIMGNLSLLRFGSSMRTDADRYIDRAEAAARRARDLTQQLLTFAQGGNPVLAPGSIADIIRESVAFSLHGSQIEPQLTLPADLPLVSVDAGQMSQVVQNLVLNARNAMQDQGQLAIRCRHVVAGQQVEIQISDTGCGISTDVLDRIFEPFFTTRATGNGLGLSITHSIITRHGGQIKVDSVEGEGTTFTILLPVGDPEARRAPTAVDRGAATSGRILFMDDQQVIRHTVANMLGRSGYDVSLAVDGADAVSVYAEALRQGDAFDLVMLDLTVPGGIGGEQALAALLEIDPDVRAVVCSGYSNDEVMAHFREHGFVAALAKPFGVEDLQAVVSVQLEAARRLRRAAPR